MDSGDGFSYLDLTRQNSTRRYIYEGYGGQNHDKTLVLQKSETCSNDTIVLRLCKRISGRITWSSCFKGKLLLATLIALMAIFCYFNLFPSYLPKTCLVFAIRSSQKPRSFRNETVFARTKTSLSEKIYPRDLTFSGKAEQVSTFTRKVALDMQEKFMTITILQRSKTTPPKLSSTVFKRLAITPLPATKSGKSLPNLFKNSGEILSEVFVNRISDYGSLKKEEMLISRIIRSGKVVNSN